MSRANLAGSKIGMMNPLDDLLGESPAIAAVREKIRRVLARPAEARRLPPVLIQGETGTGKGLVAQALHRAGPRATGPFVDVNCAAIPETLLEAEMFGFERGAFTDARQAKRGLFQTADRGTLFLDEVGLLPEGLQAKLLKVIEERVVRRLGSTQSEPVDVWVIAATSTDLPAAIRERRFREDLYHRLAVLTLWMPPLRERGGDILLLAERFLSRACADYGLAPKALAADARAALQTHAWPGNIRELSNVMERAALLSEASLVAAEMLGLPAARPTPPGSPRSVQTVPLADAVDSAERAHLLEALHETDWNVTRAAVRLGVSRNTLRYRIEKHGLRPGASPPPTRRAAARPVPAAPAEPVAAPAEVPAPADIRWERRRLTVLRVDLVLASGEEARLESSRALEIVVDKVRSFGGRVESLSPTGIVAVFGLEPIEDAPRRAANVAMAIQRAAERAWGRDVDRFTSKAGVHVGQFLIGQVSGGAQIEEDAKREAWQVVQGVVAGAEPGTILVSEAAAPFLRQRFDLAAARTPSGMPGQVYRLEGLERPGPRFGGRTAKFVGRDQDLKLLRSRLESAARGQGQVVGIAGEAGIGKSRLLLEFRQSLAEEPFTYLEGHCLSYGSAIPYLPVLDILRMSCRVIEADTPEAVKDKVHLGLKKAGMNPLETAPYLLQLLGLKDGTDELAVLSPEVIKGRTFETLRELSLRLSRLNPLIIVVEDLHWIDQTSQEFLASLVEVIPGARILLVVTHRPGYRPPWIEKSYATQMALQPLTPQDSLSVVHAVFGTDRVADSLAELILAKAEGNPFFIEELARAAREQRSVAAPMTVPDTIEEVLLARIDRLPPREKRLIQATAVIGKTVPFALVGAVADLPEEALRRGLMHLQAAEFLYETSSGPDLGYTFKHALTHEVAYGSLLEEERRALHARIVEAIERLYPDRLTEHVERLAHHALGGSLWEKAVTYLRQAGAKAASRSANQEAVAHFEQALLALKHLTESRDTISQAIDLRFDLRNSLHPLGELGRILDHLREAETLAEAVDEQRRLGWVSSYMTQYFRLMGAPDRAIGSGQRALAIAAALGDFALQVATNAHLGPAYRALGDYHRAIEILRTNLESLRGDLIRETFGLAGLPYVICCTNLVWCLADLGEFSEGIARGEEGVRVAEAVDHPYSLIFAYLGLGTVFLLKGELQRAIPALERALALCRLWTVPVLFPVAASSLGPAYMLSGRFTEAVPLLEEAVDKAASLRLMASRSIFVARLGEAYLLTGRSVDAIRLARHALELSREQKERGHEVYALRLLGEIASRGESPDADRAEAHYRQAMALADELGMRPLLAHCHLGLGKLFRRAGDRSNAEQHLMAATALLREMQMRPWLMEGEAELNGLG